MGDWLIEASAEKDGVPAELLADLEDAVQWTLEQEKPEEVELSVALVSDATIAALNKEYLAHEGPTDVLSFPLRDPRDRVIGDIYIGLEQAERQADEVGVPRREEVLRLVIHGTLHVLGWEHPEDGPREESPMFQRQEELLRGYLARVRAE